ncbi:MAG TPA: hypothetical protein VJB61_20385 [Actinomycetota bacterium]
MLVLEEQPKAVEHVRLGVPVTHLGGQAQGAVVGLACLQDAPSRSLRLGEVADRDALAGAVARRPADSERVLEVADRLCVPPYAQVRVTQVVARDPLGEAVTGLHRDGVRLAIVGDRVVIAAQEVVAHAEGVEGAALGAAVAELAVEGEGLAAQAQGLVEAS